MNTLYFEIKPPLLDNGLRVAVIANTKQNTYLDDDAPDDGLAEYDSIHTVQAIADAITAAGHRSFILEADDTLLDTIRVARPDISFNIAEGLRGSSRESHVPALLDMLGIPFTGGGVLTHAISLDKSLTKQIWRDAGLPTAPFQVFRHANEALDSILSYPLFVKPVREGSGMGINSRSVARTEAELHRQVTWVQETYRQAAIVETYLPGREFTVGLIGNTLSPGRWRRHLYDERGFHVFPILEVDASIGAGEGLYNTAAKSFLPGEEGAPDYICPARIDRDLEAEMKQIAVRAFEAVDGLDMGRVDFRLGADGRPYLLEINTLPGLNPLASDMCIAARAEGLPYDALINEILSLACERYGLRFAPAYDPAQESFGYRGRLPMPTRDPARLPLSPGLRV